MADVGSDVYKITLDDSQLRKMAQEVAKEFQQIGSNAQSSGAKVDSAFSGAGSSIKNTFSEVTSSVLGGFKQIAAGAVGLTAAMEASNFVKTMYQQVGEFNKSMQEVSTISQEVSADMNGFKQQILEMTSTIPIGANESAKALYQIISAGQQGANAMNVLEVSAKAAIGGVTDTATAADTITTILNAYKMSANDAYSVSDKLFTTVKLGKTTMGELGQSIAQAAPIAASFGVSLDELLGAVASLTKMGTPTAQAMTQIRAAITGIQNALGDGAFTNNTFAEAMQKVIDKANGSQNALQKELGTVEAMNAVLGLTGKNASAAASDLESMKSAAGATEEAFGKMTETADNQVAILQNNLIDMFSPIANKVEEATEGIAHALNTAFETGAIDKFADALKAVVVVMGVHRAAMLLSEAAASKTAIAWASLTLAEQAYYIKTEMLIKLQRLLNITMLSNPFVAVASAVTVLVLGLVKLNDHLNDATRGMTDIQKAAASAQANIASEQAEMRSLITAIKSTNEGTEERKKLINDFNSKYGSYLENLLSEKATVNDLEKAYNDCATAIRNKIANELKNEKVGEINKEAIEEQVELTKKMTQELLNGGFNNTEAQTVVSRFLKKSNESLKDASFNSAATLAQIAKDFSGTGKSLSSDVQKFAREYTNSVRHAYNETQTAQKEIDAIIGTDKPKTKSTTNNNGNKDDNGNKGGGGHTVTDEEKKAEEQRKQVANELLALQRKNQQASIDLEKDGIEKRKRQRQLDYQQQLDEAEKMAAKWKAVQNNVLTEEQKYALNVFKSNALKAKNQGDIADYKEELSQYRGYFEQRADILQNYENAIKNINEYGGGQAKKDEAAYQKDEALKELDQQFAQREQTFNSWADSIVNMSLDKLKFMLMQATVELEQMENKNPNDPKIATQRAKVQTLTNKVNEASQKTTKETDPKENTIKRWQELQKTLGNCSKQFEELGNEIGGTVGEIISGAGSIATNTISIIGSISDLANNTVNGVQKTGEATNKTIQMCEKASVILSIISAALQIAQKVAGIFAADMSSYNEMKDKYEALSEVWDELIDKKKEYISISYATEASKAADEAQAVINEKVAAARQLAKEYASSGGGFFSHSKGYKMNQKIDDSEWKKASQAAGVSLNGVGDLINLSAEQLQNVKEQSALLWASLDDDFKGYLQDIIDAADEAADVTESLKENLTSTTFDDVKSNFLDTLMDMDADASDFADSVAETFTKAMLNQSMLKKYNTQLENWYNKFADDMNNGELTDEEMQALRSEYQGIVDEAIAERDRIAQITGYDSTSSSQEASSAFSGMSQETADELNGRFTALQVAAEGIRGNVAEISQNMNSILTLSLQGIGHLEDISRNTYQLYNVSEKLDKIEEHTRNL